jgi:hypothetical protein
MAFPRAAFNYARHVRQPSQTGFVSEELYLHVNWQFFDIDQMLILSHDAKIIARWATIECRRAKSRSKYKWV